MNAVIAICLIYMTGTVAYNAAKFFSGTRADRLAYLKSFKSAKVFVLYFAAIPLYYLAHRYNGTPAGGAILNAVRNTVEVVVLKYNYEATAALAEANIFYRVTLDICRVLVAANALVFVSSVTGEKFYIRFKAAVAPLYKKIYVVIGFNEADKAILRSIKKNPSSVAVLLSEYSSEAEDFAFVNKAGYIPVGDYDALNEKLAGLLKYAGTKKINVVINTLDDGKNLVCTEKISELITKNGLSEFTIDVSRGLTCHVFGGPRNEAQFVRFSRKTNGCIRYVNKYKLIASDFVSEYPITRFMDDRHIDRGTATVRAELDVKTVFVGFGETNRHLLLASVANNQLPVRTDGGIEAKTIKYYVYDRQKAEKNKNLNHGYYRYKKFYEDTVGTSEERRYLPVPPLPSEEQYRTIDINDDKFYESLKCDLCVKEGTVPYTYLIIAYGDDMENLDFADKISQKIVEWGMSEHTRIFVKIRSGVLTEQVVRREYGENGTFLTFGTESECVYDMSAIESEKYEAMSRERHLCYAVEWEIGSRQGGKALTEEALDKIKADAVKKWYDWNQVQREANVYACLNIRLKLNLLGYDFERGPWDEAAAAEFFAAYEAGDEVKYLSGVAVPGNVTAKKAVDYGDCEFGEGTVRNTYAVQEHMRWNAYQIVCGTVPASLEEMLGVPHKELMKVRKHRNLTTYDGLLEYRRVMARAHGTEEKDEDVIKYDYQIMDDLLWLLRDNGYRIFRRD